MDADITLNHCSLPLEYSHLSVRLVVTGPQVAVVDRMLYAETVVIFRLNFYNTVPVHFIFTLP